MCDTRSRGSHTSSESQSITGSNLENCQFYLPRFATGSVKSPSIQSVGFSAEQNPKNGLVEYSFDVSWCDNSEAVFRKYNQSKKQVQASAGDQKNAVLSVKCDGPCGKVYTGVEMHQYGDCDHNICPNCYATGPSVILFDTTPGCCNEQCYYRSLYILNPTAEHRHLYGVDTSVADTSQTSRSTSSATSGATELLYVRVLLFRQLNGYLNRKKVEKEVHSHMRMKEFYNQLNKSINDLEKSDIFVTHKQSFHRSDLTPINRTAFNKSSMYDMMGGKEVVTFVVVAPGVSIFKK